MKIPTLKHILITALITFPVCMNAGTQISVGNVSLNLDTLYHASTAPGTELTKLHLSGDQPLDVYYITIDLATPGLKLRNRNADTSTGLSKTSEMAALLNTGSQITVAGINGDFFDVTKTYPDGSVRPRKTTYTSIVDGRIHKTSPGAYQFIVDDAGNVCIDNLSVSKGFVSNGSVTVPLGGINLENINYANDAAPDNAVTIYTGDGWKSTFQTQFEGNCAEICAQFIDNDHIEAGKSQNLKVTSLSNSSGNTTIPAGGVVLHGRGTGKQFIESLSEGDIIIVNTLLTLTDGTSIIPVQATGGNPPTVSGGVALESDGTRPDAVELHPRTGIGISEDGKKVIFMVVDGRGASAGVTTRQLGDLLVYVGAYEGLNFDGGGSSTCWSAPFGVVNNCSDGSERTVANSLFATIEKSAEDNNVEYAKFEEWKITAPKDVVYRPVIYGYSRNGFLLNQNLTDYTLEVVGDWAVLSSDAKSFTPTSAKGGVLTVNYNGHKENVLVNVLDTELIPIVANHDSWNITGTSVKIGTTSVNDGALTIPYTMGSTVTKANVNMLNLQPISGKPEGLILAYSSKIPLKSLSVTVVPDGTTNGITFTDSNITSTEGEWIIDFNKNGVDTTDDALLPLTFRNIGFVPGEGGREEGEFTLRKLLTYHILSSGVMTINDNDDFELVGVEEWYTLTGLKVNPSNLTPGIYIRRAGNKISKILVK